MRKTKIICTIGPASSNEETLAKMFEAGMNVARINFSHGDHAEQQVKIDLIKKVREKMNLPIAIMLDTKGPEYRIKTFKDRCGSFGYNSYVSKAMLCISKSRQCFVRQRNIGLYFFVIFYISQANHSLTSFISTLIIPFFRRKYKRFFKKLDYSIKK